MKITVRQDKTLHSSKKWLAACVVSVALIMGIITTPHAYAQTVPKTEISLENLIEQAFDHHPDLLRLEAELGITKEDIALARAAYRPQLSANGSVSISERNSLLQTGTSFDQSTTPQELSLQLNQTLYAGGRLKLAKKQAEANYDAVVTQYKVSASAIADELINDYIGLMSALKIYEISQKSVGDLVELEKATKARQQAGDGSITDIAQTTGRLASARAQSSQTRARVAQARNAIQSKTRLFIDAYNIPGAAITPYDTPFDTAIESGRRNSAQIKSALSLEEVAQYNLETQKRGWVPTISLNASARTIRDSSPTIDTDDDLRAGVSFNMPLYAGGEGKSNIRRAAAQLAAAKHSIGNSYRLMDDQITQLYSRLLNSRDVLTAQEENVKANQKAVDGITAAENSGFADIRDVLDARQNKALADQAYSQALHEIYRIRLLLRLQTGELNINDGF